MKKIALVFMILIVSFVLMSCVTSFGRGRLVIHFPGFVEWDDMEGIWFQRQGPDGHPVLYEADVDSKGPYHIYRYKVWKSQEGNFKGYIWIQDVDSGIWEWTYTKVPVRRIWWVYTWEYEKKVYWNESGYWRR